MKKLLGKRVRAWSKSERRWKAATVAGVEIGTAEPDLFRVKCAERLTRHRYRAEKLQLLK